MCLSILLAVLIIIGLALFAKSGQILLLWTIAAMVLAALAGLGLRKLAGRSRGSRAAVSAVTTLVLTMAFGYLGYWLVQPTLPPQKQGIEAILQGPQPTQVDLQQMLPIHLGIAAILGALLVSLLWYHWQPDPNVSGKGDAGQPNGKEQRGMSN
jgi:hypothetical protein